MCLNLSPSFLTLPFHAVGRCFLSTPLIHHKHTYYRLEKMIAYPEYLNTFDPFPLFHLLPMSGSREDALPRIF